MDICEAKASLPTVPNPYVTKDKKQISTNIEVETIDYFKALSKKIGIPYQNLINSYLSNCATKKINQHCSGCINNSSKPQFLVA